MVCIVSRHIRDAERKSDTLLSLPTPTFWPGCTMSPIISSMEHDQTATIVEHLDVSYGPDEAHRIDFYQSSTLITSEPAPPLLLFVHGYVRRAQHDAPLR